MGPASGNPPALESAEAAADDGMERKTDPASPSEAGEAILGASGSGKPKAVFAGGHTQSPPSYYFYQGQSCSAGCCGKALCFKVDVKQL